MTVQPKPARSPIPGRAPRGRRAPGLSTEVHRPTAAGHGTAPARRLNAPKPSARPRSGARATPGSDRGVGLLLVFVAATLLMVVAVAAVTIVDRWWVLIPVMLVDFTLTFAVIATIVRLLRDDGKPPA